MEPLIVIEQFKSTIEEQVLKITADLKSLLNILEMEFDFICEKLPWSEQDIKLTIEEANNLMVFLILGSENIPKYKNSNNLNEIINLMEISNCGQNQDKFAALKDSLNLVSAFNEKNMALYQGIYEKISGAMVIIQNQDIIRQNIENLNKCLQLIVVKNEMLTEMSQESILGYLYFAQKVIEVSMALTENAKNHLNQLCGELIHVTGEIDDIVLQFKGNGQDLVQDREKEDGLKWLREIFDSVISCVDSEANAANFENKVKIVPLKSEIEHIYKLATKTINDMKLKLDKNFSDLSETCARLNNNSRFDLTMDGIYADIKSLFEYIRITQSDLFKYYGVDDWVDEKADLKEVLSKFTCLIERKTAQLIWGQETVEVEESNDIVLF